MTYDASRSREDVCWYFGDERSAAKLDRKTSYSNGPVDGTSGDLVIGNLNKTLQGAGLDRQSRGQIRGQRVYASRLGMRGARSLEEVRKHRVDQ